MYNINSKELVKRRKQLDTLFALTDRTDLGELKDFENAHILDGKKKWEKEVEPLIKEAKVQRGIDMTKEISDIIVDLKSNWNDLVEARKIGNENYITARVAMDDNSWSGSVNRLMEFMTNKIEKGKGVYGGIGKSPSEESVNPLNLRRNKERTQVLHNLAGHFHDIGFSTRENFERFWDNVAQPLLDKQAGLFGYSNLQYGSDININRRIETSNKIINAYRYYHQVFDIPLNQKYFDTDKALQTDTTPNFGNKADLVNELNRRSMNFVQGRKNKKFEKEFEEMHRERIQKDNPSYSSKQKEAAYQDYKKSHYNVELEANKEEEIQKMAAVKTYVMNNDSMYTFMRNVDPKHIRKNKKEDIDKAYEIVKELKPNEIYDFVNEQYIPHMMRIGKFNENNNKVYLDADELEQLSKGYKYYPSVPVNTAEYNPAPTNESILSEYWRNKQRSIAETAREARIPPMMLVSPYDSLQPIFKYN